MKPIFIASNTPYAGRTVVALGLALKLKDMDYDVGYIKPFGTVPVRYGTAVYDADALFARELLDLQESIETVSPFVIELEQHGRPPAGEPRDAQKRVLAAFKALRKKDFVIVAGAGDLFEGTLAGLDARSLVEAMKAAVLFVEPWRGDVSFDALAGTARLFGRQFAGGVLNKVPEALLARMKQEVKPFLQERGVSLFGAFPTDHFLESVTVRQLSEILSGKLLCCEDRIDEHVEHFLIGAMDVDSALTYFRRTPNKAVITGAHRSDIQLAALETSTKCIIITGGLQANEVVLGKARTTGTPILSVPDDTFSTIGKIETRVGKTAIRDRKKVERARQILDAGFDMFGFLERLKKA